MNETEHRKLLVLCMAIYTILPSFFKAKVQFNYITWFIILYFIASYIRKYPNKYFENKINFLKLCKPGFIPSTLNIRGVDIGFNLKFRSMKKNMEKVVTMLAVIMGFSVIALANIWIP